MTATEEDIVKVSNVGIDAIATSLIAYGIANIPKTEVSAYLCLVAGLVLYVLKAVLKVR